MKLISEYTENDITVLQEEKDGKKNYVIEGVFAQAEKKNRNGRMYPKAVMEKAVGKYVTEQVKSKRSVGELNHPDGPTVNLDKVSHLITDMKFDGDNVVGKARILPTPMGKIVEGLLDGGVRLGVSTRGMGSLEKQGDVMVVKDDYLLNTVDIVQDPSAPNAFVNGIMEGVEWIWDNGILAPRVIEEIETEIKTAPKKDQSVVQVREFKNFLSLLKQSL
tara:strand:- start:1402 stop:2058 length:657 start_codon:yes stop_codon:yes gene_type:complete